MKMNSITKALVALFVMYTSSCLSAAQSGAISRSEAARNKAATMFPALRTKNAGTLKGQPIVKTPVQSRDMSGDTMYALPYEEESTTATPFSKTPVGRGMIGEPIYRPLPVEGPEYTSEQRPGMMYAS
jgi:hypothetical protein